MQASAETEIVSSLLWWLLRNLALNSMHALDRTSRKTRRAKTRPKNFCTGHQALVAQTVCATLCTMSQHPLHHNLDDVLANFIGSVSELQNESILGYWHVVKALRSFTAQIRTLRQKPCVLDNQDIQYGRRLSGSLLKQRQFSGEDFPPSSSASESYGQDELRAERPSSLSSAPSIELSADADKLWSDKMWSPMLLDFGPGRWTSHDNERFFTSHTSAAHPLYIATVTADITVDPQKSRSRNMERGTPNGISTTERQCAAINRFSASHRRCEDNRFY